MHEKMQSNPPQPSHPNQGPLILEDQSRPSKPTLKSNFSRYYNQISSIDIRPNLPFHISRFMGYRESNSNLKPIWLFTWLRFLPIYFENLLSVFFCSFLSILLICLTYSYSDLSHLNIPLSLGSAGATAIILFVTPLTPTATPRNVIFGHLIASLTSTIITRIFKFNLQTTPNLIQGEMSRDLSWLTGCLSMSLTAVFQVMTGTVHPPGGATALLGAISPNFVKIGWEFISITLVMVALQLAVALVFGNLGRKRYPLYWFFPPKPEHHDHDEAPSVRIRNPVMEKDRLKLIGSWIHDSVIELETLDLNDHRRRSDLIKNLNHALGLINELDLN
ncbi:HPP family protein [Melampsora larici-populina 98AG31]|uniref:HPP family protein n=1 Tax=Melampsora larici-populina (strain 98AG31 / pathotype 3-4-7) TaxID=747676 RepID=F4R311_MELLP|nr:HPP family protein [Melampsora larici-populina 98AG31]EGG13251.1 HPP family protein [Melampsora larici-populina 98AG31]